MHATSRSSLRAALAAFVLIALAPPALAQRQGPVTRAEILPGWQGADGRRMAALRIEMQPGWHTYWRIPGEAGIAPVFDWSASQNLGEVRAIWPRPEVFDQNGYVSYGYEDELILPLEVTPRDPGRPVALIGQISLGVCRDTCVPAEVAVSGALRGAGAPDARISGALAERAHSAERAGLARATCRLEPGARGIELILRTALPRQGAREHLIVELPGSGMLLSEMQSWREGGELVARARVRPADRNAGGAAVSLDRSRLAYTILSEDRMIAAQGCVGGP